MGPHQSKTIQRQLAKPVRHNVETADQQLQDKTDAIPPLKSASMTEIPAAKVDRLKAKIWNPNSPDSWEPDMRGYHSFEDSNYALPSDEIEQNRLEAQHYLLRGQFHGDIVCPEANELVKLSGTKILDVGCAKGFWLESVRKENPLCEYHGVDIAESLTHLVFENVNLNVKFGNVLDRLPYDDNTFDYTHQRLLVFGMPREKYPDALRELIRVTKLGGWIELVEVDIMVYKAGPYSKKLSQALLGAMQARGLDCYAATNLEWHASKIGANISKQEIRTVHLPSNDGTPLGMLAAQNGKDGLLALEDWMHIAMGITREEYRELVKNCFGEWKEYNSFAQVRALYFQVKK